MPTIKKTSAPIFKTIQEKTAQAREAAVYEIKVLRKDLDKLEKLLSSNKGIEDFSLLDLVHGVFETYRHASLVLETQNLEKEMEKGLDKAMQRERLEKNGAKLLKKPEGWHWISPKGEMHFLGESDQIETALETLLGLKGAKKAKKAAPAKGKEDSKDETKK